MDSILTTTKKLIGMSEDDTAFDTDVMIHINSALSFLCRLESARRLVFVYTMLLQRGQIFLATTRSWIVPRTMST